MIRAGWAEHYVPNETACRALWTIKTQHPRPKSMTPAYGDAATATFSSRRRRRSGGDWSCRRNASYALLPAFERAAVRQRPGHAGETGAPPARPFASWRAGYRHSLGIWVFSANAHLKGGLAVVTVRIGTRDRDACSHQVESQNFRGRWLLAPGGDSWVAVQGRIRAATASRVRLHKSESGRPRPFRSPRRGPRPAGPCCRSPPGAYVNGAPAGTDGRHPNDEAATAGVVALTAKVCAQPLKMAARSFGVGALLASAVPTALKQTTDSSEAQSSRRNMDAMMAAESV